MKNILNNQFQLFFLSVLINTFFGKIRNTVSSRGKNNALLVTFILYQRNVHLCHIGMVITVVWLKAYTVYTQQWDGWIYVGVVKFHSVFGGK